MSFLKKFYYKIKNIIQKILRKSHISDYELFDFYIYLSIIIYPKLKLYINKQKEIGNYPNEFIEYSKNCGYTLKEYNKFKKQGLILGGGYKAWEETLSKILFSFEYIVCNNYFSTNSKKYKNFAKKYGNIYEETISNYKETYWYKNEKGRVTYVRSKEEIPIDQMCIQKEEYYFNDKLDLELNQKVEEGLLLFGKYFRNLWL